MNLRLFVCAIFFLFSNFAKAAEISPFYGNSTIASAYNQLKHGRNCGQVTAAELKTQGFTCSMRKPVGDIFDALKPANSEIFDQNIFNISAESQVERNKCLTEQIAAIQGDKNLQNAWQSFLIASWMGIKKSELMLNTCNREVFSRIEKANVKRYGIEKAYEISLKNSFMTKAKPLPDRWKEICFDDDAVEALKAATYAFKFSVPVISNPEFFKNLEDNRDMLINTETGKPLTDEDLLAADLSDDEGELQTDLVKLKIKKKASPNFENNIYDQINTLKNDRTTITDKITKSKSGSNYDLDAELIDYMYEDGTVLQTLKSKKLIPEDYSGLGSTDEKKISNGAFCMLARFEPTMVGELIDMGVQGYLFGKLFFSGAGKLIAASKTPVGTGMKAASYLMVAKQIAKACPVPVVGDKPHRMQKVASMSQTETQATLMAGNLPKEVGYAKWNLEIDQKKTPSCKTAEQKNLMFNSAHDARCLLNIAILGALKIAFPKL